MAIAKGGRGVSTFRDRPWFERAPRRPPPERGVRIKKSGSTWWGRRWIEALEKMSSAYSNRLPRGRAYARAGRAHDFEVNAGYVTAHVTGSRLQPYVVTIRLRELTPSAWDGVIRALAAKAEYAALLLRGEMPEDVDLAFESAGASLFPRAANDLITSCSCPDVANPCKHVAATHYVLGAALDRDPFLLFELRGRKRDEVLEMLRRARGGAATDRSARARRAPLRSVEVDLSETSAYDAWRAPMPGLRISIAPPASPTQLIEQLGSPAGWSRKETPAQALLPLVSRASAHALELAVGAASTVDEEG
jgi:uncharacterized Zn finger protein